MAGIVGRRTGVPQAVGPPACEVTAYIPDGDYGSNRPNIEVVPIVGTDSRVTLSTVNPVNSCSANQSTNAVVLAVCTDNLDGIYLINGSTPPQMLTSGGENQENFSKGSCTTCGVVVDSANNRAIISIADNVGAIAKSPAGPIPNPSSPAGPGLFKILDLAHNNALSAPISGVGSHQIGQSFGLKPGSNLILSANNMGQFDLVDTTAPIAYAFAGAPLTLAFETAAIDSTGIAIAGGEGTGNLFLADLSQASLSPSGNFPTWNAPSQVQPLTGFEPSFGYFGSGIGAMAIAFGSNEAFLEDEFGVDNSGAGIGAIKLPLSGGIGIPAALDWVVAHMPTTPDNASWNMPHAPQGLTAVSANLLIAGSLTPGAGVVAVGNTPRGIGFIVNNERTYLGVVDLDALVAAPRGAANQLDPNFESLQQNVITYIQIPEITPTQTNAVNNSDFNDGFGFYLPIGSASVKTDGGSCPAQQVGNPYASLNVPDGGLASFEQQILVPGELPVASEQFVKFTRWGIGSPVTVKMSVVPNAGTTPTLNDISIAPACPGPDLTRTVLLNSFAGQSVTLKFEAKSAPGSGPAIANFDNISVGVRASNPNPN